MTTELRVLGQVEVLLDGVRADVGHARQQCVLAVLLVEAGRVVTTEQLLERVWAEQPPHRARQVVSTYVSRLRQALAADGADGAVIERRSGGYVLLTDPDRVDAHRFRRLVARARAETDPGRALESLEEALALWRGEAFAGLDTPWLTTVRAELARERFAAETDRVDLALRSGRHAELLPELTARAAAHPLDERVAAQLVLALYRAGRQAEALTHYEDLRTRLSDELGADPGPALRELHQRILTADPTLAAPGGGTTTAAAVPVPRQLPAPPRLFTGRDTELARLDQALTTPDEGEAGAGTVLISAIGGAGGIGKTWLALAWAHRHADRFPDGQLFVDLRGFSPDSAPMDPAVAVRGFLDALGVPADRVPPDAHAQAALFRSLAAGRRLLVVLDNAATTAQVAPLLPGSESCTVLITSRHRLPGLVTAHAAHHLRLDVLADRESRALLALRLGSRRVDAEPEAVAELIALCGGFPLALGIIAARAHTRPTASLAGLAAELRDLGLRALADDDPAASLPTVLSWSLRNLTDEQRRVFVLLGIVPGPDTGLPAAAVLTDLPPARARQVLRALEEASLLDRDARGRHRTHDLVRAYAATTAHQDLTGQERDAALRRVVDFHLHTAYAADRLLDPHRPEIRLDAPETRPHPLADVPAALAWLEAEHTTLLAAQHTAAARGWHDVTWQLAFALGTFHYRQGHRHECLTAWRAAADAAAHLPDPATRTLVHRQLGIACARLGHHEEAVEHLERALALAEQHHDTTQQTRVHEALAGAWEQRGDDRRALEHALRALDLHRTLDQPVGEAYSHNTVGWHAARVGDYDTARTHCQAALALHRRHDSPVGEAHALGNLGYIAHHTGRHEEALDHYLQALPLLDRTGDAYHGALGRDWTAQAYAALGRLDEARATWREALDLYRRQGRDADAERVRRHLDDLDRAPVGGTA